MAKYAIPAVVLVGGKGSRMGGIDKPLLTLAGRPLLDHILERLRPQVSAIALATPRDPSLYSGYGLPLLPDPVSDQGPVIGLASALAWASTHHPSATHVALLAGDTPFLPADLIERLAREIRDEASCIFAKSNEQIHYSTGLWPILSQQKRELDFYQSRDRSLKGLALKIGVHVVDWPDKDDSFFNINTPEDLARAEERVNRLAPR